jgi:methionine-R-sulfoxide reductase
MKKRAIILFFSCCSILASCQNNSNKPVNQKPAGMETDKVVKTEEEWKKILTPEQYEIIRKKGTEAPFSGKYDATFEKGTYTCAACDFELFKSDMKFDSRCGWPSFDNEIAGDRVKKVKDFTHGMVRTEILCARCGGHLGHIFDDGPTATGNRYCVNSVSIHFIPDTTKTK